MLRPGSIPRSFARISPAPGTTTVNPIGTATAAAPPETDPIPTTASSGSGAPVTESARNRGEPAGLDGDGVDVPVGVCPAVAPGAWMSAWERAYRPTTTTTRTV